METTQPKYPRPESLTEYEKKTVDLGIQDMKEGRVISNKTVKEQFKNWVESKQK